jgi:hypothetical protein
MTLTVIFLSLSRETDEDLELRLKHNSELEQRHEKVGAEGGTRQDWVLSYALFSFLPVARVDGRPTSAFATSMKFTDVP